MASDLYELLQRSLEAAKQLQDHLASLNGTASTSHDLLNAAIQAHTAHLINHTTIVKHIVAVAGNESDKSILETVVSSGDQMLKDSRSLQEHIIVSWEHSQGAHPSVSIDASAIADGIKGLHVAENRGARPTTTPYSAPSSYYRAPTVEASEDDAAKDEGAPAADPGRKIKAHKKRREDKKENRTPTTEADAVRSSPKRQLEADDDVPTQTLVKRTKLSLTPEPTASKRKSDVSMIDIAEDEEVDEESSPHPKRRRGISTEQEQANGHQQAPPTQPQAPNVEYDDITAEVDARMQQREQRKEREKKAEMGVVDKRKRMSNDSFQIELGQEVDGAEKRERKRKKKRHSGLAEG
jgi:hypothetical protein